PARYAAGLEVERVNSGGNSLEYTLTDVGERGRDPFTKNGFQLSAKCRLHCYVLFTRRHKAHRCATGSEPGSKRENVQNPERSDGLRAATLQSVFANRDN